MTEVYAGPVESQSRFQFNWILPVFFQPRKTMTRVAEQTTAIWLTPLLLLTLAAILMVVVAGPLRATAAQQNVPQEMPPDYQWWTPEMQERYQESLKVTSTPVFTYVLPGLSILTEIWFGWLLMGALLHLVLTISGSRTSMTTVLNVVAWSMVPISLRFLVRTVSMLITKQLITNPGLVGFTTPSEEILPNILRAVLPMIDLYFIWMLVLIVIGLRQLPGMTTVKAITSVLITALIFLLLMAVPGFISAQLGGISVTRPFFF